MLDCNGFEENFGFLHVGKVSGVAKGCDKNVLTRLYKHLISVSCQQET